MKAWRPVKARRCLILAAALLLASTVDAQPVAATEYLLGPQDKVRLKVYEWRASRDAVFEWTALNDEFTVGADGSLFLPFAGAVQADGRAPADVARSIGDLLMRRMGLGRQPDVAMEVVKFRPFYIMGHVAQPGEFPFRPGLTVLQAVGIAGGLKTREETLARLEREIIAGRGDISLLATSNLGLLARKARLEAELAGADHIEFPPMLTGRSDESIAAILDQERALFAARRDGLANQLRALKELRDFLDKECASLEEQLALQDRQIELIRKELSGVSTLVNKGLVVAPREMSLERTLAQVQSEKLTAETSLLRARQEIIRTDLSIIDLGNRQTSDAAAALRETQQQLNEIKRKTDTAVLLLHDSETEAPRLFARQKEAETIQPAYTIVRTKAGSTSELPATESTTVEPGDTIKVVIPLPDLPVDGDVGASPLRSESLLDNGAKTATSAAREGSTVQ